MGRPRTWTDEQLAAAVAASSTLCEVMERLGLSKGGASLTTVRRRMLELGLDSPRLLRHASSPKWIADPGDDIAHAPMRGRWTDDELRMAVIASTSMREVLAYLDYSPNGGGAWAAVKARIRQLGLDVSHFGRARGGPGRSRPRRGLNLENLRIRCPNCHAQIDTRCGRNHGHNDWLAPVPELVYGPGSKPGAFGHEGSNPSGRTAATQLTFGQLEGLA